MLPAVKNTLRYSEGGGGGQNLDALIHVHNIMCFEHRM